MQIKKNPLKNLEKRKTSLLFNGLLFACSAVLVAFEWRVPEKYEYRSMGDLNVETIEVEIIPVSRIKTPPPPPPPTVVHEQFKIVDEVKPTAEPVVFSEPEPTPEPVIISIAPKKEELPEDYIPYGASVMPEFVGGEKALFQYLGDHIRYPQIAREAGISGKVYLTFVVDTNGVISNIEVLKGIGGGCDEEAVRVLRNMPPWNPGKNNGQPVRVHFNLPVNFTLK